MTERFWDRMAPTYEDDNEYLAGSDLVALMRTTVADAVPPGDVVELGCGTGWYTRAYAGRCRRVVATDTSSAMLAEAARTLAAFPHVTLRPADAAATGLPGASADAVVVANVLDIVPDPGRIVTEAARLLRPGGTLLVVNVAVEAMTLRQKVVGAYRLMRRWRVVTGGRRGRFLSSNALERLARAAGLEPTASGLLTGRAMNAVHLRALKPLPDVRDTGGPPAAA